MSFTVAAIVIAGLQAGAQLLKEHKDVINCFMKENKTTINATLKQSNVIIKNIEQDHNRKQYDYNKWIKTETGLVNKFLLPNNRSINNIAVAVKDFFDTYDGTKVIMRQIDNIYMVSCETTSKLSKAAGYHIKCNVIISKRDNYAEVEYQQLVNDSILKAIFLDNAISGTGKLICAMDKKEIPMKLDKVITDCLT